MDQQTARYTDSPVPESRARFDDVPGLTPREKLQNLHARLRASANAGPAQTVSASVTPSSAGDIDPTPPASIPETLLPLSVRVHEDHHDHHLAEHEIQETPDDAVVSPVLLYSEQPGGVQTIQPSALFEQRESSAPSSLQLGPSEFALTLPMDSRIKDEYERAIAEQSHSVRQLLTGFNLLEGTVISEAEKYQIIANVRNLVERLDNISVHPDLNIAEQVRQSLPDPQKEASWAEYVSSKFLLLGHLMEVAGAQELHIIIMVKQGTAVELVERYFLGKGFTHTRPRHEMNGVTELSMVNGPLSVGIQTTQRDGIIETFRPPSVIIALDSSFNAATPSVEHLRTTYARHGNLLPVVRLIISNTSEHIQKCLPDLPELRKLRLLVYLINNLRDLVGDLQDDALGVHEDAEELFTYLLSENFNSSWALPTIEPLHISISDDLTAEELADSIPELPSVPSISLNKRLFDAVDSNVPDSKRQRVTTSQGPSQSTESSKAPSQKLDTDLKTLESHLLQMKNAHANELGQLQATLSSVQAQLAGREKMLETLQHRYESRTKELHSMRQERDRLTEQTTKTDQKVEKQQSEITKLKDERTQLKHDLETARNALKAEGGLTEELESAREEVRKLTSHNTSLERKAEYEKKQAEYTREQYQNASTAAAQSGIEVRQLQEENQEITRKLTAEAAKLKELRLRDDESKHLRRVAELELTLAAREELLRRKEEELRNIRNNRPATRATSSQPRSPKWGPGNSRPTSPGVNNGIGGRGSALRFSSEAFPL